mgnify:CR=1 FL=1
MEYSFNEGVQTGENQALVLNELIYSSDSTTKYLEELKKSNLRVSLERQIELEFQNRTDIVRYSALYFGDKKNIVLYCTCILNKGRLSKEEFQLIKAGEMPIGRIFLTSSDSVFKKENIKTSKITSTEIAKKLYTKNNVLHKKVYNLIVGCREIGIIA